VALSATLDSDGHRLIEFLIRVGFNLRPTGIVECIKVADDIARLDAGLCSRGTVGDPFDHDRVDGRNLVDAAEVDEHQHEGEDKIGRGAGDADKHALPAGMGGKGAGIVGRGDSGRAAGRVADLSEVFAGHFDVAAQGEEADLVVGIAVMKAKEARAEAEGECFDAYLAELGDGEMAEFMDDHHDADQDDKGYNGDEKFMHRCAVISLMMRSEKMLRGLTDSEKIHALSVHP
jgi:hypothetical protein